MSVRHHQNRRSERTLAFDAAPELGSTSRCGLGLAAWPVVVAVMLAAGAAIALALS